MIAGRVRTGALLLALVLAVGCRGHGADGAAADGAAADAVRCASGPSDPGSLAGAAGLAGAYRLVLVAETGPAAGEAARGTLRLVETDSAGAPLRGWTDLRAAELGATVPGDAASREPDAPGVRVLVTPADPVAGTSPRVTVRLGSHANRVGPPLFDEAYAVLRVEAIAPAGFRGSWASGMGGTEVGGRFCAERLPADGEG